jgi:hypothetical protein
MDAPVTAPTPPPPGGKCNACGHTREVKMDKPGTLGKSPAKGTTKFRSLAVKKGPGRQRIHKRDPRWVNFY